MGHHYVAQYYLKGFATTPRDLIWVYDKQDGRQFCTQVKSVANETGFYPQEIEEHLANCSEEPADAVIAKVRAREAIATEERGILAEYITVMIKRVPRAKQHFRELAPAVAQDVRRDVEQELTIDAVRHPLLADVIEQGKARVRDILARCVDDPLEFWSDAIPSSRSPEIVEIIRNMTWLFLIFDKKPAFLTCDNPVFFPTGVGIGHPQTEISFPLSSHTLLWASRQRLSEGYYEATTQEVEEFNRRTASNTTRYIYHMKEEDWVLPLAMEPSWQLCRVVRGPLRAPS